MAHDEQLAARIRELLGGQSGVSEKGMFGGLAFLVGGHMAVAASGQGGLLVRVDPSEADVLLASVNARPLEMRGRELRGWLRVDVAEIEDERRLLEWVDRGVRYARSLPPKR